MRPALLSLIAGCACLAGGGYALYEFRKADWFNDPGPDYPDDWEGYNKRQFVGCVFFTFLVPPGFTLMYVALTQMSKVAESSFVRMASFASLVLALLATAGAGTIWAQTILVCGGTFCTDVNVWLTPDPAIPEAGYGWLSVIGCSALFSCAPLALALIAGQIRRRLVSSPAPSRPSQSDVEKGVQRDWGADYYPHQATGAAVDVDAARMNLQYDDDFHASGIHANKPLLAGRKGDVRIVGAYRHNTLRDSILLVVYLVLTTLFFFTTTTVPNSWEYFAPDRIASFAAITPHVNGTICDKQWQTYTCPEMEGAIFRTIGIRIAPSWVIKIFPGNLMLYLYLTIIPSLAFLVQKIKFLRQLSRSCLFFVFGRGVSVGEIFFFASTSALAIVWIIYWMHDHNYNGYWPKKLPGIFSSELVSRMLGQLAVLFMSLLMFPAARNILSSTFFGVSWEAGIQYHRWLGILFLLAAVGHMIANYVWFAQAGEFPADIMQVPMHLSTSKDNFTVPLVSLVLWMSIITLGVIAVFPYFRRTRFELFYYLHHITYMLLIPAVLWHAAAGWEYLLPGVTLWFCDRVVRAYRSSTAATVLSIRAVDCGEAGRVTEICVATPSRRRSSDANPSGENSGIPSDPYHYPGQYVFLNIAQLSLFQWHPFTISSASPDSVTFLIKDMGQNTWTSQLHEAALKLASSSLHSHVKMQDGAVTSVPTHTLTVTMDGPYGHALDFNDYKRVLVVAGGIGITPARSIFVNLAHQAVMNQLGADFERGFLLWIARDESLFSNFGVPIGAACARDSRLSAMFACASRSAQHLQQQQKRKQHHQQLDSVLGSSSHLPSFGPRVIINSGEAGRPDVRSTLLTAVADTLNEGTAGARGPETLLFVCGPPGLTDMCAKLASVEGWSFHSETFEL